jgi:endoglucanase
MYLIIKKNTGKLIGLMFVTLLSACGSGGGAGQSKQPITETPQTPVTEEVPLTLPTTSAFILPDEISPQQAISTMGIGINLGNTLDAPNEGDWALAAQNSFLVAFKNAGFKHVRIPVTWDAHTLVEAPYTVEEAFMDRVEEIVDWALAQDLYVILNAHHEAWLKNDYQQQKNKNRIDSIWMQVAARFKEKSAKLMFEMLNEPHGMSMDDINQFNPRTLSIIRNENPNRLVVFSGNGFTPIDSLLTTEIPDVQDQYLIGNFHSYDPWQFAGQCTRDWGTEEDKAQLRQIYQKAFDWTVINNIPVMVNEFGVAKYDFENPENVCQQTARLAYLQHHVSLANEFGIAGSFWDDGGSFSTFDRENGTWGAEKDILVSHNL